MNEKRILFLVTICTHGHNSSDYYVIAPDETSAANRILRAYTEWNYSSFKVVTNIKRIATEGQYGEPKVLLFS